MGFTKNLSGKAGKGLERNFVQVKKPSFFKDGFFYSRWLNIPWVVGWKGSIRVVSTYNSYFIMIDTPEGVHPETIS